MSKNWQDVYQKLLDFLAGHPEIKIETGGVSIPREVRDEFYVRFDAVRKAFVENYYSELPPGIDALSENYTRAATEVSALLALKQLTLPIDLASFLADPKEGLTRAVYNRLFDLLQGKIPVDAFQCQAKQDLQVNARELLRLGYERWVALAFMKLLEPDEALTIEIDEDDKIVPSAKLEDLSFGRQTPHVNLRVPEFVLHSRRIKKYATFKLQLATEVMTYSPMFGQPAAKKRRTGDTSYALDSRIMVVSTLPSLKEIPPTAILDKQKVSTPDLIVECLEKEDFADPVALEQVARRNEIFHPTLGTYVVSRDPVEEANFVAAGAVIHAVEAGFDASKLRHIVDQL